MYICILLFFMTPYCVQYIFQIEKADQAFINIAKTDIRTGRSVQHSNTHAHTRELCNYGKKGQQESFDY